ncbi:MAG TPA: hypothetical protein VMH02_05685 [Verrucomicrobiae bacterium]|nr:hypothetical protein [Verrucomicrobiae bacterium]
MDASGALTLVASSTIAGQQFTLPGPGKLKLIVTSTDARTAAGDPLGPVDNLVGLQFRVSYALTPSCDLFA